jgi:hypothetical protein
MAAETLNMRLIAALLMLLATFASARAQTASDPLLDLSRQKWLWMSEQNVAELDKFDEKAVFVHMGATMTKSQELDVIKSGRIRYKRADIQEISVRVIGDTAIVLSTIELFALVGGNEANNPFFVTETYVKQNGAWKLGALAFTRRLTPPAPAPAQAPR